MILEDGVRIDGRKSTETGRSARRSAFLPRTHGSALFTRGETQALVGHARDQAGRAEGRGLLEGSPPRSSCSTTTSRRSAWASPPLPRPRPARDRPRGPGRALGRASCPSARSSPTRSGSSPTSSSPTARPRWPPCAAPPGAHGRRRADQGAGAGIAMGLVKEGERYAILTDIMGDEDHYGDMDFKVAGTGAGSPRSRWTSRSAACPPDHGRGARARRGRRGTCSTRMREAIAGAAARAQPARPALRDDQDQPEKIREVIGPGGKIIRGIQEQTGARSTSRTTARSRSSAPMPAWSSRPSTSSRGSARRPRSGASTSARSRRWSTSAPSWRSCRAPRGCSTSPRSPRSGRGASRTSCARATWSWSRSSRSTRPGRSGSPAGRRSRTRRPARPAPEHLTGQPDASAPEAVGGRRPRPIGDRVSRERGDRARRARYRGRGGARVA